MNSTAQSEVTLKRLVDEREGIHRKHENKLAEVNAREDPMPTADERDLAEAVPRRARRVRHADPRDVHGGGGGHQGDGGVARRSGVRSAAVTTGSRSTVTGSCTATSTRTRSTTSSRARTSARR
jgi:hypothetical protein